MNKNNIFNGSNIDNRLGDYLGVVFYKLYNANPYLYRIYFDNDEKLKYIDGTLNFTKICANLDNDINIRELILNLKERKDIEVFYLNGIDCLIMGKEIPFVTMLYLTGDTHVTDAFIEIYCEQKDIEKIFNSIKDLFVLYKIEECYEFGIATCTGNSISTAYYDYEKKDIDIDKNYNNDFLKVYDNICKIIEKKNDTGLILLYGEPGTGKSTVIKSLISKYPETEFVFIDGSLLSSAQHNTLVSYFINNQNTVFILEDCEKVLLSREEGYNPIINTLLNITDGIIGDVLGIKLICTFNTSLDKIDKALLRKGRLSLKYEFKKLKSNKVSAILGKEVNEDMTLADIYNIDEENDFSKDKRRKIGF